MFQVVYGALLFINATVGASWVFHRWHHYKASPLPAPPRDGQHPGGVTGPADRL